MSSTSQKLAELLGKYDRVVIYGAPKTGKTTLSAEVRDRPVIHTDDFRTLPWSAVPEATKRECEKHKRFVLEGVRALGEACCTKFSKFMESAHANGVAVAYAGRSPR